MRLISTILIVLLLLVACASAAAPTQPAGDPWTLVIVDGRDPGVGPGLSVADALTHGPTDDIVSVTGALFVTADGDVLLCDAIAESFPPQCGGERIVVDGLDLSTIGGLQEENGVRWAESVTLLGSVEAG
jgi:hypothetical protein